MIDLLREYDKMLLTYRQRIVLEDGHAYSIQMDYGDRSLESFRILKQKHKYSYVISMHNNLFAAVEAVAVQWGYQKLALRVEKLRQKMGKERIPLPISVPCGMKEWDSDVAASKLDIELFLKNPLFAQLSQ